jgi:hypothetical protein
MTDYRFQLEPAPKIALEGDASRSPLLSINHGADEAAPSNMGFQDNLSVEIL